MANMGMGKAGVAIVALVIGLVGGGLGGAMLAGGTAAGAGAAAGISTGMCTTVRAAQDLGFLTPEQVDLVFARAAKDAGGGASAAGTITGSAQSCDAFLAAAE